MILSAALLIQAELRGQRRQAYFSKPLASMLVLVVALLAQEPPTARYQAAVAAGLLFSLAGDIFLVLPSDRFLAGLIAFLAAHLSYIFAFSSIEGFYTSVPVVVPLVVFGLLTLRAIREGLGRLAIPAAVYTLAILVMLWQAIGLWQQTRQDWALLVLLGAVLFTFSDTALALNRFRRPIRNAQLIVLAPYYAGQLLIALSVSGFGRI